MKKYVRVDVKIHVFLTSALVGGGQLHAPVALTLCKRGPDTHWIGGCVGPRTGLDDMERRNFDPSAVQPVASSYTDSDIREVV
jgi:hypothetical protein